MFFYCQYLQHKWHNLQSIITSKVSYYKSDNDNIYVKKFLRPDYYFLGDKKDILMDLLSKNEWNSISSHDHQTVPITRDATFGEDCGYLNVVW